MSFWVSKSIEDVLDMASERIKKMNPKERDKFFYGEFKAKREKCTPWKPVIFK